MRRVLGLVAVLVALALPAGSGASRFDSLQCGAVVTHNVTLTADMTCAGGYGLIVPGSVDATVNLNGHTINGDGSLLWSGILIAPDSDLGYGNPQRSGHITIQNGTIRNFDLGVEIDAFSATLGVVHVDRVVLRENYVGAGLGGNSQNVGDTSINNSTIANNRLNGVESQFYRFGMSNDRVVNNGAAGIFAGEDSLGSLGDSFIAYNGGDGANLGDTVAWVVGNKFVANAGTGLAISESFCPFVPFYNVSDNVAEQNRGGGMSFDPVGCPTPVYAPGGGNGAQHNDVFQCILIVCATKAALSSTATAVPDVSLLPVHH